MLNIKDMTYYYSDNDFVDNLSTTIPYGVFAKIDGEKGAGKTVFIKLLAGILFPEKGKIELDNINIDKYKRTVGNPPTSFVFQSGGLISNLNIYENIKLALEHKYYDHSDNEVHGLIDNCLETNKLDNLKFKRPSELTMDETKMIVFFRAILMEPKVLILQEPFDNLERKNHKTLIKYCEEFLDNDKLIILLNRNSEKLNDLVNYSVTLDKGKVISSGYVK